MKKFFNFVIGIGSKFVIIIIFTTIIAFIGFRVFAQYNNEDNIIIKHKITNDGSFIPLNFIGLSKAEIKKEVERINEVYADSDRIMLRITEFNVKKELPNFSKYGLHKKPPSKDQVEYYEPEYYIVQFKGSVKDEWKNEITSFGAEITNSYIPNYAFITKMNGPTKEKVEELSFVNWVGIYQPAFKIPPELLNQSLVNKDEPTQLAIKVFDEENCNIIATKLVSDYGITLIDIVQEIGYGYIYIEVQSPQVIKVVKVIANISFVEWVEEYYKPIFFNDWSRWISQSNNKFGMRQSSNDWQPWSTANGKTIDPAYVPIFAKGIDGTGQIVGVADTGLDYDNCYFKDPNNTPINFNAFVTAFTDNNGYGEKHRKIKGYQSVYANKSDDFTGHGTHVCGTIAGDQIPSFQNNTTIDQGDGIAPKAKLLIQDKEPLTVAGISASTLHNMLLWAYSGGARIHSNSWGGTLSGYDFLSQECDRFMWEYKDFLLLFAVGNDGQAKSTATAKSVVTVGATESGDGYTNLQPPSSDCPPNCTTIQTTQVNQITQINQEEVWNSSESYSDDIDIVAYFSSKGPGANGLLKPNVCAPGGANIWSADSDGDITTNNCAIDYKEGTSMSTPLVAGLSALIRQYLVEGWYGNGTKGSASSIIPSGAFMKAMLIASTRNIDAAYTNYDSSNPPNSTKHSINVPDNEQGWGRIVLDDVLYFNGDSKKLQFRNSDYVGYGQGKSYKIFVGTGQSLKIVLSYSDYPSTPESNGALVNDLDLTVSGPSGTFKGNIFNNGFSVPFYGSYDHINPDEVVWIKTPEGGYYTITVKGTKVNVGPQYYSLVVVGNINTLTTY